MLRVNTFIVTVFVSLHFHTLLSSLHSSFSSLWFIHHFHHVHSPWESVLFNYIVSSVQCYCHIRSPPHIDIITSTDHHFFRSLLLSPPLPLNMPVRGLYGHGKGSYGHGLAHTLPVPALYGHGKGVSALTGYLFLFYFLLFVNEGLNGKPLILSWRHTEHFVDCVYFPTHRYQTASAFGEHIALFQLGHNFSLK